MGMMFFLEINAMILSPLFVEAWHAVDFRRTLLDFIIDDKLTRGNPRLSGLYFKCSSENSRFQMNAISYQRSAISKIHVKTTY
jgi:hypothetical protein